MNELRPFLFEGLSIRGALVRLRETWRSVVAEHHYPRDLERLLGEGLAATVLLGSALKHQPRVSIQLQGEGRLRLLLVQCRRGTDTATADRELAADFEFRVRAMAQWRETTDGGAWLHEGRLAVNVDTGGAQGLYQGIVPLVSQDLGQCLESYFQQSEQLPTRLVLKSAAESQASAAGSDAGVAGLLLQALPGESPLPWQFDELTALANTVSAAELNSLPADELLPRLFGPHTVRLFQAQPVLHDCRCTPEHLAGIVRMLGEAELRELLLDQGRVELNCEFCNRTFRYDESEVDAVLRGESPGAQLH